MPIKMSSFIEITAFIIRDDILYMRDINGNDKCHSVHEERTKFFFALMSTHPNDFWLIFNDQKKFVEENKKMRIVDLFKYHLRNNFKD